MVNERRRRNPLFPFSILRIKGLAAADATQLIAFAGFISMFFFLTLYMQNVLGYSPIESGAAYLPGDRSASASPPAWSRKLFARIGTRPIIVAGALIAAAGDVLPLADPGRRVATSRDLLPGLLVMSLGLGAVFVTVTTAANAGVPADKAGLAAGLLNTSLQLGSALGLAIFSAIATARTKRCWPPARRRPRRSPRASSARSSPAASSCSPPPSSRCAPPMPAATRPSPPRQSRRAR